MKFEGNNIRKLTGQKEISFLLNNAMISNLTGDASFGFSGENKSIEFKFDKGRIYDANGFYVHSYDPSSKFSISGYISEDYYDYYIDEVSIARGAYKENFKIENFFINTNDCYFDSALEIYSDGIPYTFTIPSLITLGESFVCQMANTSADGSLYIFNAQLKGAASADYAITSFPTEIGPQETKDFVFSSVSGRQGNHAFNLELDTNIGPLFVERQANAREAEVVTVWNELSEFESGAAQAFDFTSTNSEAVSTFIYDCTVVGGTSIQEVLPTLEYVEGNIGKYYKVTGVNIINPGEAYHETPNILFSDGQGNDIQAEASVEMEGSSGDLTVLSVNVTNSGVYYDQAPVVVFSGGGTSEGQQAQGVVVTEEYEKTFTNSWDIYVGLSLSGSVISYKANDYTGNQGENAYPYTNYGHGIYKHSSKYSLANNQSLYVRVQGKSFDDYDQMKVKLKVGATMADSRTGLLAEEIEMYGGNIS